MIEASSGGDLLAVAGGQDAVWSAMAFTGRKHLTTVVTFGVTQCQKPIRDTRTFGVSLGLAVQTAIKLCPPSKTNLGNRNSGRRSDGWPRIAIAVNVDGIHPTPVRRIHIISVRQSTASTNQPNQSILRLHPE